MVEKTFSVVRRPFDFSWFQLVEDVAPEEGVEEEAVVYPNKLEIWDCYF